MTLSIVIVSWNTRKLLKGCLSSIFEKGCTSHFEVIVIDNASGDGSPEMVRQDFPHVRLMKNDNNRGFTRAVAQGIEMAEGRYLLLLNSDTLVKDGALNRMIEFMETHKDTGIAGGKILYSDGSIQPSCYRIPSFLESLISSFALYRIIPRNIRGKLFLGGWWDHGTERNVGYVSGAFMMIRSEALKDVGGLPMDVPIFYGEDMEWCYQMWKNGWKVSFCPLAEVVHLRSKSSIQRWNKNDIEELYYHSLYFFYQKHFGKIRTFLFKLVNLVGIIPRGALTEYRRKFYDRDYRHLIFHHFKILIRDELKENNKSRL